MSIRYLEVCAPRGQVLVKGPRHRFDNRLMIPHRGAVYANRSERVRVWGRRRGWGGILPKTPNAEWGSEVAKVGEGVFMNWIGVSGWCVGLGDRQGPSSRGGGSIPPQYHTSIHMYPTPRRWSVTT